MARPHPLEASRAGAAVPGMAQPFTTCHLAKVCPPPDQVALHDGVINRQGLALPLFRGPHVEITTTARRHLYQAVQGMHLGVVVGETDLGLLTPPDQAHFGSGPSGLFVGFPVSLV